MEFRDKDFSGQEVLLDGNVFTGCTFRQCRVVFRGEHYPSMSACSFKDEVLWTFDGPAAKTLKFLSMLFNNGGEGGRERVEEVFDMVRNGL